jgi:flap endonuclease-1
LHRRHIIKAGAEEEKKLAEETGNLVEAKKMAGRSIKVTPEMTADAKRLITLMGLPVVEATSEAEAQCSVICAAGKAFAVATEDMDALTFGTPILIRGFNNKKEPLSEIHLDVVLKEFGMTMDQFIDLCILCGCDYTTSVDGIGPVKAYKYVEQLKSLEAVIAKVDNEVSKSTKKKKYTVPKDFDYVTARRLFKTPNVIDPKTLEVFNIFNYFSLNGENLLKKN